MPPPLPPKFCARCLKPITADQATRIDLDAKGQPQPYHTACWLELRKEERIMVQWMRKKESEEGGEK